jgi:bifunctional NMN adenylyltransferase/nudix hydrolase
MARFQSPYLHEGHRAILEQVMTNHNKVVIILGVLEIPRNVTTFFRGKLTT